MKMFFATILGLLGAVLVAAQEFPANMPDCGRVCGTAMLNKGAELGCPDGNIACLCRNVNFGYGIHDCSISVCAGNIEQANIAIAWGNDLCLANGVTANISTFTPTPTGDATVTATVSEVTATVTSDTSTFETTFMTTVSSPSVVTSTDTAVNTSVSPTTTVTAETTVGTTSAAPTESPAEETSQPQDTATTSTSTAMGAQATVGPALGFLAAAGIAVAML
ncbi:hypothetical protein N656DRAFT_771592 [Canariomyces notabilis]|uniref:CFEM domain-containing protein n=1 Tax=Canariomyces notabilis TaxID=2074819 RepID=A0AAN6QEC6_9PEZI|nr:hypothetical protein N656DRAFT_771592 [Canariomyces arenarius]